MEMEIKFELENNDTEYIFTPDFRVSANYTDETNLSWRLPSRDASLDVGVLRSELQIEGPLYTPILSGTDV